MVAARYLPAVLLGMKPVERTIYIHRFLRETREVIEIP